MFLIPELILLSPNRGAGQPEKSCSVAGEELVVDGDFLLEEISFALIDREFSELFGMLFQVNFPKEEHVRTLPPDLLLPALDFLFSAVSDVPLAATHHTGHTLHSTQQAFVFQLAVW